MILLIAVVLTGCLLLLKCRHAWFAALMLVLPAIILGLILMSSSSSALAAEGAAAGAPAAESTEGEPAIGVPVPIQEEPAASRAPETTEKGKRDYVPAAVSGAGKPEEAQEKVPARIKSGRWFLHAGVGYAFINKEISASLGDETISQELDSDLYPFLRGSYQLSDRWAFELGFAGDFYAGTVNNSESEDSSDLSGYTVSLNSVVYGNRYDIPWAGTWRPFALAGLGYRIVDAKLDYPVSDYKPGFGVLLGLGAQKGNLEVRIGYSGFKHDPDGEDKDFSSTGDALDTSGISLEISYRFNIF